MKDPALIFPKIRIVCDSNYPSILDIELSDAELWAKYDSFEFHWVIYPYSRKISANDLEIHPFEEYVKDILGHRKSAYIPLSASNHKRFGLFLGIFAALIVGYFHPEDFVSMEGIVSFFGAYIAGKELWADFEKYLIRFTRNRRLRYLEPYYSYELDKNTTLTQYSAFARTHRYEKSTLNPVQIDYIEQSNSKTVRLKYDSPGAEALGAKKGIHLLSLHIHPSKTSYFHQEGYLLGVKISLNKRKGLWIKNTELYQSISKTTLGALDTHGQWKPEMFAKRISFCSGRWKYTQAKGEMIAGSLIEKENSSF